MNYRQNPIDFYNSFFFSNDTFYNRKCEQKVSNITNLDKEDSNHFDDIFFN